MKPRHTARSVAAQIAHGLLNGSIVLRGNEERHIEVRQGLASNREPRHLSVVMLGPTGAGKTSLLTAMYEQMQSGVKGFSLETSDVDQANSFRRLLAKHPGIENRDFSFVVRRHFERVATVDWHLLQGGLLTEQEQDLSSVQTADCLLYVIEGRALFDEAARPNIAGAAARLKEFVGARRPLVVFVVTKVDLLPTDLTPERNSVHDRIRQFFDFLFVPGNEWVVAIIPVSLLVPESIPLPLMFALQAPLLDLKSGRVEPTTLDYLKNIDDVYINGVPIGV